MAYLWVALGGAIGSMGRYWVSGLVSHHYPGTFPLGTLLINIFGSFIIGFFAAMTGSDSRLVAAPGFRPFFMVGICGGFTTFSSFSLETLKRLQEGEWFYAGANILLSMALCLIAVWLGYLLGATLNSMKGH
ncbi:MAG TPA: fluoride efflux transporter CrcB [Verrucomicrobiae bacterium]